jgi:hypothetical protein
MKTAFWLGLLVGFGGVLSAAHFYPWVVHTRLPSQTSVVANGGRAERFVIRLPADRIQSIASLNLGLRGADSATSSPLAPSVGAPPLLIEHFKIRDAGGNVIGIAARHWTNTPSGAATAWSVLIPSRGVLLLTAPGEARSALDTALRGAGFVPGSAWTGDVRVDLGAVPKTPGVLEAGSQEFAGLHGSYTETWTVTGVSDQGELRGTIELDTVTFQGS